MIIIVRTKIIVVLIVVLLLNAEYHFLIFWGFHLFYSLSFSHVWAMIVVIIMILLVEIIICPMIIVRSSCYKHLVALDAYIFDYIILQYVHVNLGESVDFICTTDNWKAVRGIIIINLPPTHCSLALLNVIERENYLQLSGVTLVTKE